MSCGSGGGAAAQLRAHDARHQQTRVHIRYQGALLPMPVPRIAVILSLSCLLSSFSAQCESALQLTMDEEIAAEVAEKSRHWINADGPCFFPIT